jgi:hypothetical protein
VYIFALTFLHVIFLKINFSKASTLSSCVNQFAHTCRTSGRDLTIIKSGEVSNIRSL